MLTVRQYLQTTVSVPFKVIVPKTNQLTCHSYWRPVLAQVCGKYSVEAFCVLALVFVLHVSSPLMFPYSPGDSELKAYKYSEERAMAWLERRARRLAAVLETKGLHGTSGKADNFVKVGQEEVDKGNYNW